MEYKAVEITSLVALCRAQDIVCVAKYLNFTTISLDAWKPWLNVIEFEPPKMGPGNYWPLILPVYSLVQCSCRDEVLFFDTRGISKCQVY